LRFAIRNPLFREGFILSNVESQRYHTQLTENVTAWGKKPMLRRAYFDMFRRFIGYLAPRMAGLNVECGSGIGNLTRIIPDCLKTDLHSTPWSERIENVYRFSFKDSCVDNLILFDVFHHLQFPTVFFTEASRVLRPGGRLLLIEPAMGALPKMIYKCLHGEPLASHKIIDWSVPSATELAKPSYYAAQANAWRIFWQKTETIPNHDMWNWIKVDAFSCFAYFVTGGFSAPQILPNFTYPFLRKLDNLGDQKPEIFAGRLLVVLERERL
jgi:SAM-dependent methyltransferase